jgi:hypothetical protein
MYLLLVGLPHHMFWLSLETWPPLSVHFKSLVESVLLIGLIFMCCVFCFACPRPVSCLQTKYVTVSLQNMCVLYNTLLFSVAATHPIVL